MQPADALHLTENALRLCIRQVLGDDAWLKAPGAPDRAKLEERRAAESKRRSGVVASEDLLEYTETYHLTSVVLRNWASFKPVFKDHKRTEVYFKIVEDFRNSIAHSRMLMIFERELLSGVAGHIRAQVAHFRSMRDESTRYYPLIEDIHDSLGNSIPTDDIAYQSPLARFDVGDVVSFTGSAFAANGLEVIWMLQKTSPSRHVSTEQREVARGETVEFSYRFTEADVKEHIFFGIAITTPSSYHRHGGIDDIAYFHYQVNPPQPSTSGQSKPGPHEPHAPRRWGWPFRTRQAMIPPDA